MKEHWAQTQRAEVGVQLPEQPFLAVLTLSIPQDHDLLEMSL